MKHWHQSKTIWLQLPAVILAILELIDIEFLTAIGVENPTRFIAIISMVTAIITIILRTGTSEPIANPFGKKDFNPNDPRYE